MKLTKDLFRVLFKLKYVIVSVLFLGCIGFLGDSSLINRKVQKEEIARLEGEIAEYDRKFEEGKRKIEAIQNDHEEVMRVARELYFMKNSNEDVFVVEEVNEDGE